LAYSTEAQKNTTHCARKHSSVWFGPGLGVSETQVLIQNTRNFLGFIAARLVSASVLAASRPSRIPTMNIDEKESERGTTTAEHAEDDLAAAPTEPVVDPTIVDFDGPDDPEHPWNWPTSKKWINGGILSLMTFIT
jgi:hypothetical protein